MDAEKNIYFHASLFYFASDERTKNLGLYVLKINKEKNSEESFKNNQIISLCSESFGLKLTDFYSSLLNQNRYLNDYIRLNMFNGSIGVQYLEDYFKVNESRIFSGKRRRRRKFSTEDERRMARILKNRRTAEESRQRRIQKMKQLENLALLSEEKEKKLRDEIKSLGKQIAIQTIESISTRKKHNL